jgi:glycosyltransferase involved in cell wall biosynthesis
VAISDGVGTALARRFGIDPTRVFTIHNAVDVSAVRARAQEPAGNLPAHPFIAAAGRLVPQKGFDLLIRAFAARLASRPISLVIAGEGPERSALEALALSLNLQGRVQLPGFLANPWSYFARAAAFVCSSRWEGFGNVIIEAMACGVPVVSTDCDYGPREIIRHNESGLLVPVENVDALAEAIGSVVDDQQLASRLAESARRRAYNFDVGQMTRAYEQLFRELTSSGRPEGRPLPK